MIKDIWTCLTEKFRVINDVDTQRKIGEKPRRVCLVREWLHFHYP